MYPDLEIYKLQSCAKMPTRGSEYSACFDIYSYIYNNGTIDIYPGGEVIIINTKIIMCIPFGYNVKMYSRSGLAFKHGITLCNDVAVIDSDYKKEIMIGLVNNSDKMYTVSHNERIAQFEMVESLPFAISETYLYPQNVSDRDGGLGSTGK